MSNEKVDREMLDLDPQTFGRMKAGAGIWASCIRIVDPVNVSTV
jgi:splicing factor 3B subunit 3